MHNTGSGSVFIPVGLYKFDGTLIGVTNIDVSSQISVSTWVTVYGTITVGAASEAQLLRTGLTQVNDNATATVLTCQWIWCSKHNSFIYTSGAP